MFDAIMVEAPLHPGAGVKAGTGVTLPVDVVAVPFPVFAAEHVVQTDLPQGGDAGVGGDVPSKAVEVLVGPGDHHHRVPSQRVADARLHVEVARIRRLVCRSDGVEVGRLRQMADVNAGFSGRGHGRVEHLMGAFCALPLMDGKNGFGPFDDLLWVVGRGGPCARRGGGNWRSRGWCGLGRRSRRCFGRGFGGGDGASVPVSVDLELGADFTDREDVADVTAEVGDRTGHGRGDFDGRLVRHHGQQGLIFDDGVTDGHEPFDDFAFDNTFSNVGQAEGMEAHGGPSPHIGGSPASVGLPLGVRLGHEKAPRASAVHPRGAA